MGCSPPLARARAGLSADLRPPMLGGSGHLEAALAPDDRGPLAIADSVKFSRRRLNRGCPGEIARLPSPLPLQLFPSPPEIPLRPQPVQDRFSQACDRRLARAHQVSTMISSRPACSHAPGTAAAGAATPPAALGQNGFRRSESAAVFRPAEYPSLRWQTHAGPARPRPLPAL